MKTPAQIRRAIAHVDEARDQSIAAGDLDTACACKAMGDSLLWVLGECDAEVDLLFEMCRLIDERN